MKFITLCNQYYAFLVTPVPCSKLHQEMKETRRTRCGLDDLDTSHSIWLEKHCLEFVQNLGGLSEQNLATRCPSVSLSSCWGLSFTLLGFTKLDWAWCAICGAPGSYSHREHDDSTCHMLWFIPWPKSLSSLAKKGKQTIICMVVNALFRSLWRLFVFDRLDKRMCHTASCHDQDQPFRHISGLWNTLSLQGWHFGKLGQLCCVKQYSKDFVGFVGCLQKSSAFFGHHSQWLTNLLHPLGLKWTQRRKMRAGLEPLVKATPPLGALPCLAAQKIPIFFSIISNRSLSEGAWIAPTKPSHQELENKLVNGCERFGLCQGCNVRTMNNWATMSLNRKPKPMLGQCQNQVTIGNQW